jgi:hypothetical protein
MASREEELQAALNEAHDHDDLDEVGPRGSRRCPPRRPPHLLTLGS